MESSGVAGHPESYFNRKTLDRYANTWGIERPSDGGIDHTFVEAAVAAGRTANGVFGGRIMGESWPELLEGLTADAAERALTEPQLLEAAFGRLKFVHLRRDDAVAQAVSWAKSLQTHFWHPGEDQEPGGQEPSYDPELIGRLVDTIETFEAAWTGWFSRHGIDCHEVTYEQLAADPIGTAHGVLDYLELAVPRDRLRIEHRRQAEETNADWISRFRSS